MPWTKIKKYEDRQLAGKAARTTPAVQRPRSGSGTASLILPQQYVTGDKATFYSDGNGKLAVHIDARGDYSLHTANAGSKTLKVTIPSRYRERIPYGTTDVDLSMDGDMWVLDLNSIGAGA